MTLHPHDRDNTRIAPRSSNTGKLAIIALVAAAVVGFMFWGMNDGNNRAATNSGNSTTTSQTNRPDPNTGMAAPAPRPQDPAAAPGSAMPR